MYEVLTLPTAFPALGHDVNKVCRTHPKDLLAQKVSSPPQLAEAFVFFLESMFRANDRQRVLKWI
jgi:hypothetical protein